MDKEIKYNKVAEGTVEVCFRVLVKRAEADAAMKALHEAVSKVKGVVVTLGGYVESLEGDELEEILDSIPDEVVEAELTP